MGHFEPKWLPTLTWYQVLEKLLFQEKQNL